MCGVCCYGSSLSYYCHIGPSRWDRISNCPLFFFLVLWWFQKRKKKGGRVALSFRVETGYRARDHVGGYFSIFLFFCFSSFLIFFGFV